jgi:hypothetical protein
MGSDEEGHAMMVRKTAIREALTRLRVEPEQVIELRALNVPQRYGKPGTVAGWFADLDKLTAAAVQLEERGASGIYVTLNVVNPALLARACNRLDEHPKALTGDADILRRVWLPLDFDPVRPAGISATDAKLRAARERALDAVEWLESQLNERPTIWAFSGNGYHVLYRVDLPNDDAATDSVKRVLNSTADRFSDAVVSVDRTVFNAARIWKLYGTLARKGDAVPSIGRIHGRACILAEGFES